jgi:hypothetical protein
MNHKLAWFTLILISIAIGASAQRRPQPSPSPKPLAARLMVQGTYEETYQGKTSDGNAEGSLVIKFAAARWVKMGTNEVGNAEFSELENAPVPYVSGSVSYNGRVKGSRSGGESYEATSSFAGPLGGEDVVLSVPEYTNTGDGFKIKVFINPKLKGKCSLVAVRNGETATASDCNNGTYFFTASTPLQTDDNNDPAKTTDTANVANFGIELDVEPEVAAAGASETGSAVDQAAQARRELEKMMGQGPAGDAGVYAWRGAVTNGSKEAGFKILLNKTKELPSDDKRGNSVRKLNFTATIVPGAPK